MITKKELEDYRLNRIWVEKRKQEIAEAIENANRITSSLSNVHIKSQVVDTMAENVARIVDMQNAMLVSIANLEAKLNLIQQEMEGLRQPYKNILYWHYVNGKTLTEIAAELGYTYRNTTRLFGIALNIIKKTS